MTLEPTVGLRKRGRSPIGQTDLVVKIARILESAGLKDVELRVLNAIIEAADLIVDALNREPVRATPGMGLRAWLASDDTGLSSRFMAHICAGGPGGDHYGHYPHDPSDFGRCLGFLEAVPEARENLDKLRQYGPEWGNYVATWAELERLYREEFPTGSAPKLYALMQELQEQAASK